MDKEYFAFISYKREDEKWAKWLAHELDSYKLPSSLNGKEMPPSLRKTFRDVDELSAGNLPEQIYNALSMSDNLIVVCSPRSANSKWVNKEIEDFIKIKGDKANRIFPFIIEGEPFSNDETKECFPPKLRTLPKSEERLGGNINEQGGRNAAVVKVVAGMLGVSFDSLWNRYEREQKRKRWMVAGILALTSFVAISIAGYIWHQNSLLEASNWKMKENQTRAVTEKAGELVDRGDSYTAKLLLLEVLPSNIARLDRPYVSEAEYVLRRADNMDCSTLYGHNSTIFHSYFSPDGKLVITGSNDGSSKILDVENGMCIQTLRHKETCSASFSPDQKYIVTLMGNRGSYRIDAPKDYNNILIWDFNTGKCVKTLKGHTAQVINAFFSNDSKHIISSSWDGTVRIWNIESENCDNLFKGGEQSIEMPSGSFLNSPQSTQCISQSPNGEKIITSFSTNNLEIWDVASGMCIDTLIGHDDVIWSINNSPDGQLIASAGSDKTIRIWDANNGHCNRVLTGHTGSIWDVSFNRNSQKVVSASSDSTVRIWNLKNGQCERLLKLNTEVMNASFSNKDSKVVLTLNDETVSIWDYDKRKFYRINDDLIDMPVQIAAISPNGRLIAYKKTTGNVTIWDSRKQYKKSILNSSSHVESILFNHKGTCVLTTSYDSRGHLVEVWNVSDGRLLRTLKPSESYKRFEKAFFDSNKDDVIIIHEKIISIWDVKTGKCHRTIPINVELNNRIITYNPQEGLFAFSGFNKICVVNAETGLTGFEIVENTNTISSLCFTPDGRFLVLGTEGRWNNNNAMIKIWDIREKNV